MSQKRDHERALFAAFLEVAPTFAGEPLKEWRQPDDEREFPDIVGLSTTGRRVGVEIGEWLNEEEMQKAKSKEQLEAAFLETIGDQGPNPTRHISYVWLLPKGIRIRPADAAAFREQLFACIMECDHRWPNERFWKIGHQLTPNELTPYPTLAKYLNGIKLWPGDDGQFARNWITFPMRVDVFDADTMRKPLRELVAEKIAHYGTANTGFDDLTLLVIYNRAAIYNSPADTPLHSYEGAVAELKRVVGDKRGPFTRVLLYIALTPGARVRLLVSRSHQVSRVATERLLGRRT